MNNKFIIPLLFVSLFSTLAACSDKNEKPVAEKEHFMTEKQQAMQKAEQINQLVQDAAAQQRRRIDEESQ